MKTKNILLILFLFEIGFLPVQAQNLVTYIEAIIRDTIFAVSQKNDLVFKSVSASGQVEFSSKSGYVRVILTDKYDYDLLVYESFPLLATNGMDIFDNVTLETNIPSFFSSTKIRVEIKNAELKKLSIDVSKKEITKEHQQKVRTDRITLINTNLRAQNALWVAGETSISQMNYEEKKRLFGGIVPDLQGLEYYIGGIFELNNDAIPVSENMHKSLYVSSFDWRNRHGANNPSSPYYNSGGYGWITSVKNQSSCGSCVVFSVIGTIEALTNLYYNRFLNKDLSEQDIVSCFPNGNCATYRGWSFIATINHIIKNGVCEEACFPYAATDLPCSDKCSSPSERIKINGRIPFGFYSIGGGESYPPTEESLKKMIIKYGPLSGTIKSLRHAMTLTGFGTVNIGDTVYEGSSPIVVPVNDSRVGTTYWIFKNSWGTGWGNNGYGYFIVDPNDMAGIEGTYALLSPVTSINYTDADIVCEDRDGDGYYFWGIGPKPAHCPACSFDEPDGDDSNPNLGPMDEYGNFLPMIALPPANTNPTLNIITSQTWNTNRYISENIIIQSGITLTITANVTSLSCSVITIQNGGKLILSGGAIDNAYIIAKNNSEFTIQNNGKVF
jgi:C1A family cysteine protease